MKNNKNVIIGIVLGLILGTISVYAATIYFASSAISYDNTTSGFVNHNGNDVVNVQDAIDALLYSKRNNLDCQVGYTKVNITAAAYKCVSPTYQPSS